MNSYRFILPLLLFVPAGVWSQSTPLDTLMKRGGERTTAGDVPGATAYLLEARKLAEMNKKADYLCKIAITMAKLGLIGENNQATEDAIHEAEKYCVECRDTVNQARALMAKGILCIKQGNLDSALMVLKHSIAVFKSARDTMSAMNAVAKLGNVLELQQKYAEANQCYLEFYNAALRANNERYLLTANIYLTGNYLYEHAPLKAKLHNDLVIRLAQKLGANYEYSEGLRYDAMILNQLGKNEEAYNRLFHFMHYYQDTLMNDQRLKETNQLKEKYESEKKEALIALQQEELKRQNFRFWAILAFLGVTLIAGTGLLILTARLRQRNREKEFLIKEIHHRVKNNLQILSSLLHLQSRGIRDEAALDAVREGQNRVDAMGLIHQKLYMGEHSARVEMKDYLEQLGQNMLDSFGIAEDRIKMTYQLEPIFLDVDTAIPLGLIINELLTNALKYAFPGGREGHIIIALWKDAQERLCLKVSDNGVGQVSTAEQGTGFGSNLIRLLSKKLKGKVDVWSGPDGYSTQIVFGQTEI